MEYQFNESATHSIMVRREVAKKLGILPGAILTVPKLHELREELGLYKTWPLHTPRVTNRWLDNDH